MKEEMARKTFIRQDQIFIMLEAVEALVMVPTKLVVLVEVAQEVLKHPVAPAQFKAQMGLAVEAVVQDHTPDKTPAVVQSADQER